MNKLLIGCISLVFIPAMFAQVTGIGGSGGLTLTSGIVDVTNNVVALTTNSETIPSVWNFTANGVGLGCVATPSTPATGTIKLFATTGCVPSTINSSGTVTAIGSGGGGSTWAVHQPYTTDGTSYFISADHMRSTHYSDSHNTTGFDARPTAFTPGQPWASWGQTATSPASPGNGNWVFTNTSGNYSFYIAGYNAALAGDRGLFGTFTCGPASTVNAFGAACGVGVWDEANHAFYAMSKYTTTSGSQMIIQHFCFDAVGSNCLVSGVPVHYPTWVDNNLGSFPIESGVQDYWIQNTTGSINFNYSTDGGASWITLNSKTINNLTWAGVFINAGSTMNLYQVGGIY